ncbi:hypothetical protein V2I01_01400 [Micromonospora sp. BRA006-A]|nr:hypothetical protein [Micromonospora sp. BRA006-A]
MIAPRGAGRPRRQGRSTRDDRRARRRWSRAALTGRRERPCSSPKPRSRVLHSWGPLPSAGRDASPTPARPARRRAGPPARREPPPSALRAGRRRPGRTPGTGSRPPARPHQHTDPARHRGRPAPTGRPVRRPPSPLTTRPDGDPELDGADDPPDGPDRRRIALAALVAAAAISAAALVAALPSWVPGRTDDAPATRALTASEADRVAALRVTNLRDVRAGVRVTVGADGARTELVGWVDWALPWSTWTSAARARATTGAWCRPPRPRCWCGPTRVRSPPRPGRRWCRRRTGGGCGPRPAGTAWARYATC